MHLICAKCSRLLTVECQLGSSEDYARHPSMREPAVAHGVIVVVPEEGGAKVMLGAVVSTPRVL
jgi:hypothetical protein